MSEMMTDERKIDELVWMVADEAPVAEAAPAKRLPLQIKIDVDVQELTRKLADVTTALAHSEIMERLSKLPLDERFRSVGRTAVIGYGVGAALSGGAMGTMRAMAEVERYEAQTGRPYPVCGPHRVWDGVTITARYISQPKP